MKKIVLVAFIITLSHHYSFGQRDSNKIKHPLFISVNAGFGLPLTFSLNIAHLGVENSTYGYFALTGSFINIYSMYPIHHSKLGITGIFGFSANKFDLSSYLDELATPSIGEDYNIITIMPGVYYKIPFNDNSIDFHLMVGALYFRTPVVTYAGDYNNLALAPGANIDEDGTWVVNSENNVSFSYDIGTSLKLVLVKRLFVLFNVDILHSGLNQPPNLQVLIMGFLLAGLITLGKGIFPTPKCLI